MRILVHLCSPVAAFHATEAQVGRLARRLPGHTCVLVPSQDELLSELAHADAAVVWEFSDRWYATASLLRHVFTPSAGRERIAQDPSGRAELHFGSFHGALMAESLLAMVLFMSRRLGTAIERQRARAWDPCAYDGARRLATQTALIVGYGAIGRRVGQLLSAVGVTVHGLKRDVHRGGEGAARLFGPTELHTALALADHVACILPRDTGTDRLLDASALRAMRPGAFVYNLGRGNAIDHDALADALRAGRLGGAFLDVWPEEPLPPTSPLWNTPGLFLTPHASAVYEDYLDRYFDELAGVVDRLPGDVVGS
jgi:phosphoglycerate dehydrogenase-like enzyme